MQETYVRLFSALRGGPPRTILVCNDDAICRFREWGRLDGGAFLRGETADRTWTFPSLYRAPKNHLSGPANRLCAAEIASFLTGEERARLQMLRLSHETEPSLAAGARSPRAISDWEEAFLSIDGRPAASFVEVDPEEKGTFRVLDLPKAGVASLLDFSTLEELRFAGLPMALIDREEVSLGLRVAGEEHEVPVAVVRSSSGVVGWVVGAPASPLGAVRFRAERLLDGVRVARHADVAPLHLSLRGRDIFRAREIGRNDEEVLYDFVPVDGPAIRVRATPGQTVDVDRVGERETIDLTLRDTAGERLVVPLAGVERVSVETAPFDPPYPWPLERKG